MSFSILSQIVILNRYRVWGNDQQMQTADLTIKAQCYKVTSDGFSYTVDTSPLSLHVSPVPVLVIHKIPLPAISNTSWWYEWPEGFDRGQYKHTT